MWTCSVVKSPILPVVIDPRAYHTYLCLVSNHFPKFKVLVFLFLPILRFCHLETHQIPRPQRESSSILICIISLTVQCPRTLWSFIVLVLVMTARITWVQIFWQGNSLLATKQKAYRSRHVNFKNKNKPFYDDSHESARWLLKLFDIFEKRLLDCILFS